MITRRNCLLGATGAAAAAFLPTRSRAAASQPSMRASFAVPAGACDCHTHVFGDPARFAFSPGRTYTPEAASVAELRRLLRALHLDRVVIVHPSVYGTDNACTLDALRQLGTRARGVAVIDDKTSEAQLDEMHRAGVRGIRLNLEVAGQTDPAAIRQRLRVALQRVSARKWHLQLNTRLAVIEALQDELMAATVPVVFDHFGGARASLGTGQPGLAALSTLLRAGKAYVKVSAAYRVTAAPPDCADVAPLAQALIAANPQRILWGTDWPHPHPAPLPGRPATDITPLEPIDDGRMLNLLAVWAPDAAARRTILVENPLRLYEFN